MGTGYAADNRATLLAQITNHRSRCGGKRSAVLSGTPTGVALKHRPAQVGARGSDRYLFRGASAHIGDPQIAGGVEVHPPGVPQAVGPDFGPCTRRIYEGVIVRYAVELFL